jgi:hypothetical protein
MDLMYMMKIYYEHLLQFQNEMDSLKIMMRVDYEHRAEFQKETDPMKKIMKWKQAQC